MPEVQEGYCMVQQLWNGSVCILGLSKDEMNLDTIWQRFEDFCKLQSNEVWAQFDLLTIFHQENKSVDEWYNAVQAHIDLTKYPPETVKILC